MKKIAGSLLGAAMLIAATLQIHAQGTMIYDQQSATGIVSIAGNGNADGLDIQEDSPLMQSFIPSLSAIGFVQLEFCDIPDNGTNGATMSVGISDGSHILGITASVYMPDGFQQPGGGGLASPISIFQRRLH